MNLFDTLYEPLRITKPVRLIELFAGYGSQAISLNYLGIPYEHHVIAEWATKSIKAYKDMHHPDEEYSDDKTDEEILDWLDGRISSNYNDPMTRKQIQRIDYRSVYNDMMVCKNLGSVVLMHGEDLNVTDTDKYFYIMTYSFPCQDLSTAGQGKGMERGSGTRSGMLWEVERMLKEIRDAGTPLPQMLLMENVPEVIGQKNRAAFGEWITFLDSLGYNSKWEILNANQCGIPQNRERCFCVSVLNASYEFPKPFGRRVNLIDVCEITVPDSYYLSDATVEYYIQRSAEQEEKGNGFRFSPDDGGVVQKQSTPSQEWTPTTSSETTFSNSQTVNVERVIRRPLNSTKDGCAMTIKAGEGKAGPANILGHFPVTSIIEQRQTEVGFNGSQNVQVERGRAALNQTLNGDAYTITAAYNRSNESKFLPGAVMACTSVIEWTDAPSTKQKNSRKRR